MIAVTTFRSLIVEEAEKMAIRGRAKAPKVRTLRRVQARHLTTNQFASGSTNQNWDASRRHAALPMFVHSASAKLTHPSNVLARIRGQTHLARNLD
jgi:hypothetical protein